MPPTCDQYAELGVHRLVSAAPRNSDGEALERFLTSAKSLFRR
jgi:hypothetical protein